MYAIRQSEPGDRGFVSLSLTVAPARNIMRRPSGGVGRSRFTSVRSLWTVP